MRKRVIFGIVFIVVALDCYIKHDILSNADPLLQEQEVQPKHKLLQKLKKSSRF